LSDLITCKIQIQSALFEFTSTTTLLVCTVFSVRNIQKQAMLQHIACCGSWLIDETYRADKLVATTLEWAGRRVSYTLYHKLAIRKR